MSRGEQQVIKGLGTRKLNNATILFPILVLVSTPRVSRRQTLLYPFQTQRSFAFINGTKGQFYTFRVTSRGIGNAILAPSSSTSSKTGSNYIVLYQQYFYGFALWFQFLMLNNKNCFLTVQLSSDVIYNLILQKSETAYTKPNNVSFVGMDFS